MQVDFTGAAGNHAGNPSAERTAIEVAGLAGELQSAIKPLIQILALWSPSQVDREVAWAGLSVEYGLPGASAEKRQSPEGQEYFWRQIQNALTEWGDVISVATRPIPAVYNPWPTLPLADAPTASVD